MIIDCVQGSQEWHEARIGRFTASDAKTIASMGKGLETLAMEKAAEILTNRQKDSFSTTDMDRGRDLEAEARNAYELETGIVVRQVGFYVHDDMDRVGCSPDGEVEKDGLVEIKCPSDVVYARYLYDGVIDPKYIAQMQYQMWVAGKKYNDYTVYNPNFARSIKIVRIKPDEKLLSKITEGVTIGITLVDQILSKIKEEYV